MYGRKLKYLLVWMVLLCCAIGCLPAETDLSNPPVSHAETDVSLSPTPTYSQIEEGSRFSSWSPTNPDEFDYVSLVSSGGYLPGVYDLGVWNLSRSESTYVMSGISEQYNVFNSRLLLSASQNEGVIDAQDRQSGANAVLLLDFEHNRWEVAYEDTETERLRINPFSWSSDGESVVVSSKKGLYILELDGESPIRRLTADSAVPRGHLDEDIIYYTQANKVYLLDIDDPKSRTEIIDINALSTYLQQYSPISVWINRID